MLGLVLLYWIGKGFYRLAVKYSQNTYLWVILGIISYYFGALLLGVFMAILEEMGHLRIDDIDDFALNLVALPFGLATCYGFYKFLEWRWSKTANDKIEEFDPNILDADFLTNDE